MFNLSARSRPLARLAAGMATAVPRIGDTKVAMSLLEKGAFINYQRIEDNLAIVRERWVTMINSLRMCANTSQIEPSFDAFRKNSVRSS